MGDFYKQKIVYSEIVQYPKFYLDNEKKFFAEATSFIMIGEHLEFLCSVLHSTAVSFFFKTFYAGAGLGETGIRYKKAFLENLPIPKPETAIEIKIIQLVEKITSSITTGFNPLEHENEINQIVYGLYNLTSDEIEFIENIK
jgi:hypothetical protein